MGSGASAFVLPDLVGSQLWVGVLQFITNFWPVFVLAVGLILWQAFAGTMLAWIARGASALRNL